jgi:hypothetical protein
MSSNERRNYKLTPRIKKQLEGENLISEESAKLAVEFTEAFSKALGIYPGAYNPLLINSRLQDITLRNGVKISSETIVKYLENPKESEKELLSISENLEIVNTPYRRLISYMSDILAWDFTYYCTNIEKASDYSSPAYKKDLDVVKKFFDSFDIKREFNTVTKQLYREDAFFCILRDEGEKYTLQQLQSDYCLLTGRWDYGLLFSFDYNFFLRQGIDMDMFPSIFKKTYANIFTKNNRPVDYDPSISVDRRSSSLWAYWADCSPADGFWSWKINQEKITRTPFFCGLFPDFANQSFIRALQKSSYAAEAVKILSGEVPMLDRTKANVKDAYAMSPVVLQQFLQLMRSAINESVNVVSAPLNNVRAIEYTGNDDIQSSWVRNTLGQAGINSNLLYTGGDYRPNQIETMLSTQVDELAAQEIYPYFNNFLEYHINKRTKKYKFNFILEGSNIYLDRQRRLETQTTLMNLGIVNPQKISAAVGQNPFVFQSQLDEARINGWVDNLTPIISAFQQSGTKEAGRPETSDDKLSESGEAMRSTAGNAAKIKKNK